MRSIMGTEMLPGFNCLLEPFLIIIVGSFVAVILIAMYLPMFQMGTNTF